jgi:hypothetical protein
MHESSWRARADPGGAGGAGRGSGALPKIVQAWKVHRCTNPPGGPGRTGVLRGDT